MAKHAVQIPLPFQRYDHYELEQYIPGDNRYVLEHLKSLKGDNAAAVTYLWGERGTGKSHLLQAMCTRIAGEDGRSAYIPLEQQAELAPDLLDGLEQLDLVCIDDLDMIADDAGWELAVFNLYNRIRETGGSLILATDASPKGLAVSLPDLKSRLQSGVIFHLQLLNEADRIAALKQRAGLRGIELTDDLTTYIVRRVPRDMHTLFGLLDRLDQTSLAAKRKITVPFVKEILDSEG